MTRRAPAPEALAAQSDLFGGPVAVHAAPATAAGTAAPGSDTSAAAQRAVQARAEPDAKRVLRCLAAANTPLTRDEVAAALRLSENTVNGRVADLLRAGYVRHAGTRVVRGADRTTLIPTPAGLRRLQAHTTGPFLTSTDDQAA